MNFIKKITPLFLVFRYVKNPWAVFSAYFWGKNKIRKAKFRNGLEIEFNRQAVSNVYNACLLFLEGCEISKSNNNFLTEF
jgi:hypothetical protein